MKVMIQASEFYQKLISHFKDSLNKFIYFKFIKSLNRVPITIQYFFKINKISHLL